MFVPSDLQLMKNDSLSALHFRTATPEDRPRLIAMINAAFAIETFLEGTRTDEERLAAMMQKGEILIAENGEGELLASIYTEIRGNRGYLGMLAVDPAAPARRARPANARGCRRAFPRARLRSG